jgi:predicted amidohydrolase
MTDLAIRYNIHIIGGTHPIPTADGDGVENVAFIFLRDGSVHLQSKIHATPDEAYWWNVRGGSRLEAIDTDCGPIGVLICYDSEFPELARHLVNQGAQIIFVPFCTAERQGYLRVRYCSHARAVENQIYVALAGNVGNLPGVENMDIQYAQSCILTPCDFMFARDGIAADTTPNVEMIAIADLRPESLFRARNSGAVRNLKDRRFDLYSINWHGKD